MNDPQPEEQVSVESLNELQDALRAGLRRAGAHWMRAGYEVLAGVGAFLEEIAGVGTDDREDDDADPPTKIELD